MGDHHCLLIRSFYSTPVSFWPSPWLYYAVICICHLNFIQFNSWIQPTLTEFSLCQALCYALEMQKWPLFSKNLGNSESLKVPSLKGPVFQAARSRIKLVNPKLTSRLCFKKKGGGDSLFDWKSIHIFFLWKKNIHSSGGDHMAGPTDAYLTPNVTEIPFDAKEKYNERKLHCCKCGPFQI